MKAGDIPESVLQSWFEQSAKNNEICDSISNITQLRDKIHTLYHQPNGPNATGLAGLTKAMKICHTLERATLLGANESIAPPNCNQMRPDIVLITPASQYILIELKTKAEATRQGVQELLAYATALKMQAHFVNDFIYVIVAPTWDALLTYSVKSLILDAKYVLPLVLGLDGSDFSLTIKLDLFDFEFIRPYEPQWALSPATLAISRQIPAVNEKPFNHSSVDSYFKGIARRAVFDCNRLHQSGFVMVWCKPIGYSQNGRSDIVSLSLFTVNQHWVAGEHAPADARPLAQSKQKSLFGIHQRRYHEAYSGNPTHWRNNWQEVTDSVYPQSEFSKEVIERHRSLSYERSIEQASSLYGNFESDLGSTPHLWAFMASLSNEQFVAEMKIIHFHPFGDMADFFNRECAGRSPKNYFQLTQLLKEFEQFKAIQNPEKRTLPDLDLVPQVDMENFPFD